MSIRLSGNNQVDPEAGFTIIELLIATVVFASVLILMVLGIITFYRGYYKSLNSESTQNVAQDISDTLAQTIKLTNFASTNASVVPVPTQWSNSNNFFCIGNTEFVYYLDATVSQVTAHFSGTQPSFVLYDFPDNGICAATPWSGYPVSWAKGTSLLGDKYRLIDFSVVNVGLPSAQSWVIHVKLAYTSGGTSNGDDLLCSPSLTPQTQATAGSCITGSGNLQYGSATTQSDVKCRPGSGSQFCYVAEEQSIAENRL